MTGWVLPQVGLHARSGRCTHMPSQRLRRDTAGLVSHRAYLTIINATQILLSPFFLPLHGPASPMLMQPKGGGSFPLPPSPIPLTGLIGPASHRHEPPKRRPAENVASTAPDPAVQVWDVCEQTGKDPASHPHLPPLTTLFPAIMPRVLPSAHLSP